MVSKSISHAGVLLAFLISTSSYAVNTSASSITVAAGGSQSVTLSRISGSIIVTNSSPNIVSLIKQEDGKYQFSGISPGTSIITFKDKKSSAAVTVTVTANTAAVLSGRLLASNCFQCHGTNGSGGFERLAGHSAIEIYGELKKFSNGSEDPNGIMAAHAMGFSDAQLNAIATYFSTQR